VTDPSTCSFDLVIKPKDQTTNSFLFYALSKSEIKTLKWNFGDGKTSDAQNPSNTYDKAGVYEVTCAITTASGCTATKTVRLTVQAPALPVCPGAINLLLYDPSGSTTVCSGKAVVTLMDGNAKPYENVKYSWSTGATGNTVENLCPNKQYVVKAVVENVCQKGTSFSFLTSPAMKVDAANGKYAFNVVTPEEGIIYRWEFGDGKVAYGSSVENTFDKEGNYDVKLTAISGDYFAENSQKVAVILESTSLDDMSAGEIQIYPNPVRDRVWIDFNKPVTGQTDIEVIDMKGQKALSRNVSLNGQQFVEIDTQQLTEGISFLRINNNGKTFTGLKFIKIK
jgi:PKD repeat protein